RVASPRPGAVSAYTGAGVRDAVGAAGYSAVGGFVGHGIGRRLHEAPQVPNYRTGARGPRLTEGMVLAIEPMVNAGGADVYLREDGWAAAPRDGRLSAPFEDSVSVDV